MPVHSVWTEEQAKRLLTLCCPVSQNGEFLANELMQEQTLDNLKTFGTRLREADRENGISDERPEGLVWPIPRPVIPEGFEACCMCDEPTKGVCDYCGEPMCSGFTCSYNSDEGVVCMCCYEDLEKEEDE